MEHCEIFRELTAWKVKGIMFHSNMIDYFNYLQCCKLAKKHKKQFKCDSHAMLDLKEYYIKTYKKPLKLDHDDLKVGEVMPESWGEYNLTESERKSYIKEGLIVWLQWEQKTYNKLEELLNELYKNKNYDDYLFVKEIVDQTIIEISNVRNLQTHCEQIDYELDTDTGLAYML